MSDSDTQQHPKRLLGSGFTLAVSVGGIIGLGIMRTPGEIAAVVPDPLMFLLLWLLGGLFVLLTAAVVAELVGMTPRSGGTYSLVRRAYGPFPGFVMGWVDWLSCVGDIAIKAIVISEFVSLLFPSIAPWQKPLAIMVSTVFAVLQLRSVTLGAKIQQIAAASMALIVVGFSLALLFAEPVVSTAGASIPAATSGLAAWSLVIAAIIYTYDGWSYAAYFSGEVEGAGAGVAHSCIKGVAIVIPLYLCLLAAIAWKVPLASLAGEDLALATALEMAVSPLASTVVLAAAVLILLAHQNLLYMSGPRILQALAEDGLAVEQAGKISKGGNPVFAVLLSWVLSLVLIIAGDFESLLYLSVFFYMFVYVGLIAGILTLRAREPEADRPYRAWGHPWSTYSCLFAWLAIGLFQVIAEMDAALYAAIMVAIAWPLYRFIVGSRST
jgi:APA family basic amino acid/polyamine antiporter